MKLHTAAQQQNGDVRTRANSMFVVERHLSPTRCLLVKDTDRYHLLKHSFSQHMLKRFQEVFMSRGLAGDPEGNIASTIDANAIADSDSKGLS
jgi:hypothetical protein